MSKLMVKETFVNESKGWMIGESGWYEPYTDSIKRLFRDYQKEYGRCTSKVYVDTSNGVKAVGWVFSRRERYEDARSKDDTYIREVWVEVREVLDSIEDSDIFDLVETA